MMKDADTYIDRERERLVVTFGVLRKRSLKVDVHGF